VITFLKEDIQFKFSALLKYKAWIKTVIQNYGYKPGDITFIFCSNSYILKINQQYLQHDYYTDIITFNYNEKQSISGDIFISIETVRENALEYMVTFEEELQRVMIHGILHLLGFDDHSDEEKNIMRQKETAALNIFHE
jgi:probable rRNA maturation factor